MCAREMCHPKIIWEAMQEKKTTLNPLLLLRPPTATHHHTISTMATQANISVDMLLLN